MRNKGESEETTGENRKKNSKTELERQNEIDTKRERERAWNTTRVLFITFGLRPDPCRKNVPVINQKLFDTEN